jgi:hypothetical protein
MNLVYWPFWLAQENRSLRNTYANCGRFLLLNPLAAILLTAVCVLALGVSFLIVLPVLLGSVAWVALTMLFAVEESLSGSESPSLDS